MKVYGEIELPPDLEELNRKAVRLERWSIAYMVSAVGLMVLVSGQSQAMKAAWLDDALSLLPPLVFLVAARYRRRKADQRFPYGYHRAVSAAYLIASFALLAMGLFILVDSALRLLARERASIGLIEVFGQQVWLGWVMIPVLLWSGVPTIFLGRVKQPMAAKLHDKVLFADAEMNRADWMTAGAAILGILGIGAGLWWADAVAAIVISLDITRDGLRNVKSAFADLMDRVPTTPDQQERLPLVGDVARYVRELPWVQDSDLRLREHGHLVTGEVFVVPGPGAQDVPRLVDEAMRGLEELDWRVREVVVVPVPELQEQTGTPART